MTRCHVLIQRHDGITAGHLAVLLVHVVRARTRVVADPDTEVLDLERVFLMDLLIPINNQSSTISLLRFTNESHARTRKTHLIQAHDLAVGFLDFSQLGEEIPETTLGYDIVRSEDAHAVELRCWVGIGRQMPTDDLVFLQATCWATESALSYGLNLDTVYSMFKRNRHCRCHIVLQPLATLATLLRLFMISMLFLPIANSHRPTGGVMLAMIGPRCLPICCLVSF